MQFMEEYSTQIKRHFKRDVGQVMKVYNSNSQKQALSAPKNNSFKTVSEFQFVFHLQ